MSDKTLIEKADETIRLGFGWTYDPKRKAWIDASGKVQVQCDTDDTDD